MEVYGNDNDVRWYIFSFSIYLKLGSSGKLLGSIVGGYMLIICFSSTVGVWLGMAWIMDHHE